jgi:hypothetical protein
MERNQDPKVDAANLEETVHGDRVGLIKSVQTPLGFYVVAVLVVEALIGVVGLRDPQHTLIVVVWMSVLILILIATVTFLAPHIGANVICALASGRSRAAYGRP